MLSQRVWNRAMTEMKERLHEPLFWYPFPILLAFALVLLFTAYLVFAGNPRMGSPADVLAFPSTPTKDGPLWLSVTPIGNEIVVTTADRKIFRWSQSVRNAAELKPLIDYLTKNLREELTAAALAGRALKSQVSVTIAADQRLKYLHIRPILYALAASKITRYAFETSNTRLASRDDGHPAPTAAEQETHSLQHE